jgi:hypothetical protein
MFLGILIGITGTVMLALWNPDSAIEFIAKFRQ